MAKKIVHVNRCSPQEKPDTASRYYLDSDCGISLAGSTNYIDNTGDSNIVVPTSVIYGTVTATSSGVSVSSRTDACKFLFLKNNGTSDVTIATDNGTDYFILIGNNEAFSSEMSHTTLTNISHIKVKADIDTEVEYFIGY